jgi:hypothetical protein
MGENKRSIEPEWAEHDICTHVSEPTNHPAEPELTYSGKDLGRSFAVPLTKGSCGMGRADISVALSALMPAALSVHAALPSVSR